MRKQQLLLSIALLAASLMPATTSAAAAANAPVEYTWTLAALGQGGWVGGPLFVGGTVGGGGAISMNNGQIVERIIPISWTELTEGMVEICFNVVPIKPMPGPGMLTCLDAPVTGTPQHVMLFGAPHILRVTELH